METSHHKKFTVNTKTLKEIKKKIHPLRNGNTKNLKTYTSEVIIKNFLKKRNNYKEQDTMGKKKLMEHKPNRSFRNEKHSFNKSFIKMGRLNIRVRHS